MRLLIGFAALVVLALIVPTPAATQESSLPDGVVARVGEEPVTENEFDEWLRPALRGQYGRRAVFDPPRFVRCAEAELRRLPRGKRKPSRLALRRRCKRRYRSQVEEVMSFLVQAVWVLQEAVAREVAVTPQQVRRELEREKRAAFETERAYRRFLRQSGFTEAHILFRVELDLLQQRLTQEVVASAPPVTSEDVDRYYAKHRRRYRGVPRRRARRAIRLRLTATRQERAIGRFVRDFRSRYRAITVCVDDYVVAECGSSSPAVSAQNGRVPQRKK